MNEGGLGAVFDDLIMSVSTSWLIENHYLSPYKYYGVELADTSRLHTKNGDYDKREVEELMNKSAIFGSAVENWLKLANGKKTIVIIAAALQQVRLQQRLSVKPVSVRHTLMHNAAGKSAKLRCGRSETAKLPCCAM